jgi:predicted deacylase
VTLRCTVDFEQEGKQIGVVWVPDAHNDDSAWGSRAIPIACLRNGDGPAVLLLAGNHGDEYEGQVALRRLLAETDAADVRGTLILMPCLSPPAARAVKRLWPDGSNFNRVFPGMSSGSAPQLLAHYLSTELFPRVDVVGDFHSGGRSLLFPPMATMHIVDDPGQREKMLQAALALNTDWLLVYADMSGDGLLPGEAERQGKTVLSSELGGAGMLTTMSVEAAYAGIANAARHLGVLSGKFVTRDELGKPPTRVVSATADENYVLAPVPGLLEPVAPLGSAVAAGDPLVRIYAFDEPERVATIVNASKNGLVLAYRSLPMVERGDCVALICEELDRQSLFRE